MNVPKPLVPKMVIFDEIAVCAVETDNNAYGLDKSENDAHDAGDFFDLFPAVLFLGKFLKEGMQW